MDFTIITPSFNYGHFIGECLQSVASQEGVTFEHLVIDGGSTDDTAAVVAGYSHASFRQEPDQGMSDAINKGFDRAIGDWVIWLNADDRIKPGALSAAKQFSENHPSADVIYGAWDFIDKDGNHIRTMSLFPFQRKMLIYLGCYIGSTSTFLRRSTVIAEGHRLNRNFRYVMDGEFYIRLANFGKSFAYLPVIIADFRNHGANLSFRNQRTHNIDGCLQLQKQYSEARAIRRAYGATWFENENWNSTVDAFLQAYYRVVKFFLKRIYSGQLRNASSSSRD